MAKFEHSAALQQTLESHTTYPLVSSLTLSNDYYYWQSNPSSLPQPLWRRCAKSDLDLSTFTGEDGEVFFDINSLSKEGDTASEMWGKWSASGKYWATMVSRGGCVSMSLRAQESLQLMSRRAFVPCRSDWQTVIIIDTTTGKQVDEELLNVKFCWHIEWLGDEVHHSHASSVGVLLTLVASTVNRRRSSTRPFLPSTKTTRLPKEGLPPSSTSSAPLRRPTSTYGPTPRTRSTRSSSRASPTTDGTSYSTSLGARSPSRGCSRRTGWTC